MTPPGSCEDSPGQRCSPTRSCHHSRRQRPKCREGRGRALPTVPELRLPAADSGETPRPCRRLRRQTAHGRRAGPQQGRRGKPSAHSGSQTPGFNVGSPPAGRTTPPRARLPVRPAGVTPACALSHSYGEHTTVTQSLKLPERTFIKRSYWKYSIMQAVLFLSSFPKYSLFSFLYRSQTLAFSS